MLDDQKVLKQRDPEDALGVASAEYKQATFDAVVQLGDNDGRAIKNVVVAGMGGSVLAALLLRAWQADRLTVPFEIVRSYSLPAYVGHDTLVIVSSCSGNTEETLSCLDQAKVQGAQITILTSGGKLLEFAQAGSIAHVILPDRHDIEPRMTTIAQLRGLTRLLAHFNITDSGLYDEIGSLADWLREHTAVWGGDVSVDKNYAKQLALLAVGKTPVFYAGNLMAPVAYKWKISWNENAKNVAFWNQYSEFNHNEFIGWTSHPVEKPFAIFDLVSQLEHPQILKRFELSDKLLSGKRPKSTVVELRGETQLQQMLWANVLADFASIYVGILNGVNPTTVAFAEKFKQELSL
jgi:glucose/mannose-6-phosphate isomerase